MWVGSGTSTLVSSTGEASPDSAAGNEAMRTVASTLQPSGTFTVVITLPA